GSFLRQRLVDEAPRGGVPRVQEHVGHRAVFHDAAGIEHRHAVADAAHHVHLVGDQHDGELEFAIDRGQQIEHGRRGLRVERAGGLVAQQDLRAVRQCAGDAHALLLAAGELRGVLVRVLGQTHALQQLAHAGADFRCVPLAGEAQRERDVVRHRLRGEQVEVLEDHADAPALRAQRRFGQRGHLGVADQDAPAAGPFQQVDQPDQGGLAGAGMADDAEHLAIQDVEAERLQRGDVLAVHTVGLVHVEKADHGGSSGGRASILAVHGLPYGHTGVFAMSSVHDFSARDIDGNERSLSEWRGKTLLIVNVASKCGFTPQYAGLEKLWRDDRDRGLVVLGFPCDQFGHQEPGDETAIREFCDTSYGVTFPLFAKIEVNGEHAHPLYQWLKHEGKGILGSEAIKWNFTKFLVDGHGQVVKRYAPTDTPEKIGRELDRLLAD